MKNTELNIDIFSILGEEILVEILSRFPVKTLLQLKCVCKRWCILISTPWFISMHLKRLSSDPHDHCILVQNRVTMGLIPIRNPSRLIQLVKPCKPDYYVVGSINGLVCLNSPLFQVICLWNPTIKQFKMLPVHNIKLRPKNKCHVSLGFGYEKSCDDYKVMRIVNYPSERRVVVEVYSTKLDSWREVKTDIYLNVTNPNCDVIVEGFTYWVIRNKDEPTIVASFDLRREVFSVIPVPGVVVTDSLNFGAINYHGSLALLAYSEHLEFKKCHEVWVIEGGSSGTCQWQKKITFGMGFNISKHWGLTDEVIVIENGPNIPLLMNLRTKEKRVLGIRSVDSVFYYTESLVSIEGFQPVPPQ